jgi:hypothetical protein
MNLPKLGFNIPARILSAVDFPIPFVPTKPKTFPGLGTGSLQEIRKAKTKCFVFERHSGIKYSNTISNYKFGKGKGQCEFERRI